jgi:hypothetical protein
VVSCHKSALSFTALLLAISILVSFFRPVNEAEAAEVDALPRSCTIMPLGDSITRGSSSGVTETNKQISYRKDLWELLLADPDYGSLAFVGSLTNGEFYSGFDANHEGHAGWSDASVADNVYAWLVSNPPEIVLLHIGTNGLDPSEEDVEDILDEIDRYESNRNSLVWVILARIIDRIPNSATTTDFNDNVQDMAEARILAGDEIFIVDMEDGAGLDYDYYYKQPPGDMFDSLHPYHTGYTKMASVWKDGIDQISLQACNEPPEIVTPLGNRTDAEGSTISIDVNATDLEENPLEFKATKLPAGLSIDPVSGVISGTISYQSVGTYSTSVTATDTFSQKVDVKSFTWTVTNTNRAPVIDPPGDQSSPEGIPVDPLQIVAEDPDGNSFTFDDNGTLPAGLSIDPDSGQISGELGYGSAGSYPVVITVTDNDSANPLSSSVGFTWTVTNTNRPPAFTTLPADQLDDEGDAVSLQIQASDPDLDDSLSYSSAGLPDGLALNSETGIISGILSYNASIGSPHAVSVAISDGIVELTANFTWQVVNRNGPPQVVNPGSQTDAALQPVDLQLQASDPDLGDSLTFSIGAGSQLPPGLQLHPESGVIFGVIAEDGVSNNPFWVTVIVKDNGSPQLSGEATFDWHVVPSDFPSGSEIVFLPLVIH